MDAAAGGAQVAERSGSRGLSGLFSATLFISALLMFLIQPMFAKMALPRLGGTAAVWSVALVFFQAMLLCGYVYAHLLAKLPGIRAAMAVHGAVMAAALVSLPVGIAAGWERPPESGEAFWLLGLFAASVGLPFLAISANAPLLQVWFARAGRGGSQDPYFLYAASNAGSFVALLAYPFAVEPLLGLRPQTLGWSLLYLLLLALVLACGVAAARQRGRTPESETAAIAAPATGWGMRLHWLVLALAPSGLLVSLTAYLTTDITAAPFLWVLPLAIYLLTFVIAFQARPLVPHAALMSRLALYGGLLALLSLVPMFHVGQVAVHLLLAFILMLACHGELARLRPPAARLTEFYLFVSLGGVTGGALASLAAPLIFNNVIEYPLFVIASFAVLGLTQGRAAWRSRGLLVVVAAAPVPLVLYWLHGLMPAQLQAAAAVAIPVGLFGLLLLNRREPLGQAAVIAVALAFVTVAWKGPPALLEERNFYGVLSVRDFDGGRFHELLHGTTRHGTQQLLGEDGKPPGGRPQPQSYYYAGGPFGAAIRHLREARGPLADAAVVGLGAGSMLCFAGPGERWRFFEIDPEVIAIASDPRYFTFLRDCGPAAALVTGDARISLQAAADARFDLIVLDAFSSDSVPAHLLTREALDLYLARLKPGGLLLFHISNRFMSLAPVLAAAAGERGLIAWRTRRDAAIWTPVAARLDVMPDVVAVTAPDGPVAAFDGDAGWQRIGSEGVSAWSDDYANIPGAIWRRMMGAP